MTFAWKRTMKNRTMQAYQQAPWRIQVQWIGLFLLILLLVASVSGVYLSVSASASTAGREIQYLQSKIDRDNLGIANLSSELAFLTSAAQMDQRAKDMGFVSVDAENETYIVVPGYVQQDTVQLAPPLGQVMIQPPVIQPSYTQSLWDWIMQMLSSSGSNQSQVQK
jgi:cell division protein FtsL